MKILLGAILTLLLAAALPARGRAADGGDASALLDKAIQALGGAQNLGKVKAASWTSKGTLSFQGSDNPITQRSLVQGLDHARREFEGDFGGATVRGVTVVAGDKGWRSFMG